MNRSRLILFLTLVGISGGLTYWKTSRNSETRSVSVPATASQSATQPLRPSRRSEAGNPLPLDTRKLEKMDPTNYEVTVSDFELSELGQKIERETRERLQKLTDRYQLTANQRREAFPLLVSYHADYTEGLIVNGFEARPPRAENLASELYLILDLTQQETYQEDVLADREWWGEILTQLRTDLDHSLYAVEDKDSPQPSAVGSGDREPGKPRVNLEDLLGN